MTTNTHLANSQRSDPYFTDWAAMGLPPEPGATAFSRPIAPVLLAKETQVERDRARAREYQKKKYIKAADREKSITEFKSLHLSKGPLTESPAAKAKTAKLLKAGI